jgi:hypothetical protein
LATIGGTPRPTIAGKVTKVPPPAMELIPLPTAAASTMSTYRAASESSVTIVSAYSR